MTDVLGGMYSEKAVKEGVDHNTADGTYVGVFGFEMLVLLFLNFGLGFVLVIVRRCRN